MASRRDTRPGQGLLGAVALAAACAAALIAAFGSPLPVSRVARGLSVLGSRHVSDASLPWLLASLAWLLWAGVAALVLGRTALSAVAPAGETGEIEVRPMQRPAPVAAKHSFAMMGAAETDHRSRRASPGHDVAAWAGFRDEGHRIEADAAMTPAVLEGPPDRAVPAPGRARATAVPEAPGQGGHRAPLATRGAEAGDRPEATGGGGTGQSPNRTSLLALSSLLRAQRRWLLASAPPPVQPARDRAPGLSSRGRPRSAGGTDHRPGGPASARLPVHLEESEWARLVLGLLAESTGSASARARVVELHPDDVTIGLPAPAVPVTPFQAGHASDTWTLARDANAMASMPATPLTLGASSRAGLVTVTERDGRRTLLDLVAAGSTLLNGSPAEVGAKLAEVGAELALRRWSDLEAVILVGFGEALHGLEGARYAPDVATALNEVTTRALVAGRGSAVCVLVPPWACSAADSDLLELFRHAEATDGLGVLCCAPPSEPACVWDLAEGGSVSFGGGRRFPRPATDPVAPLDPGAGTDAGHSAGGTATAADAATAAVATRPAIDAATGAPRIETAGGAGGLGTLLPAAAVAATRTPVEVAVLGSVRLRGSAESFTRRPRLTELVVFLSLHPEGATSESFATALWPDRRIPQQTLANRLSEARRALGSASDGQPRLRRHGPRHVLAEVETDWDRFRDLASESRSSASWHDALDLVRGRPFEGLHQGEWVHLEGFASAVEASVVGVACRLANYSIEHRRPEVAEWAAHKGLLVSPWDERLYRFLMRAADAMGNRGGVDATLRSLAHVLELDGDPLDAVHPETAALYRTLTSEPARR